MAVAPYYIGEIGTQSTESPTTETPFLGDWADWTDDARYTIITSSKVNNGKYNKVSLSLAVQGTGGAEDQRRGEKVSQVTKS